MEEYLKTTIAAYDSNPSKYEERTKDTSPTSELNTFIKSLSVGASVLDAGCAYGRDASIFASKGFNVAGIDLSSAFIKRAHELYPELAIQQADIRTLPMEDDTFDGIWCHATLLHLKDDDINKALHELGRVLKTGGVLFVSFKKGNGSGAELEDFTSDDERFYNNKLIETLQPMLESSGFKVVESNYYNEQDANIDNRNLEWLNVHAIKVS